MEGETATSACNPAMSRPGERQRARRLRILGRSHLRKTGLHLSLTVESADYLGSGDLLFFAIICVMVTAYYAPGSHHIIFPL